MGIHGAGAMPGETMALKSISSSALVLQGKPMEEATECIINSSISEI
jgi:hypothetical protein